MAEIKEIKRKHYVLTVKIPISCIDDCDAREQAKELSSSIQKLVLVDHDSETKLQEIFPNKPPRGVQL